MTPVRSLADAAPLLRAGAAPADRSRDPTACVGVPLRAAPTVSCVIPCFDEAGSLNQLLPELVAVLATCSRRWEVVLVDDGSTDGSPALLARWALRPGFRVLTLSRNFGKEAALSAGLDAAAGEVVVTLDADGQHPPSMIPDFVARWRAGADVVYAVRSDRRDEGWTKRIGAGLFYHLLSGSHRFRVPPGAGDFRLMDRAVVDTLLAMPERNRFLKGLYAWAGFDAVPVPYQPPPRRHGSSRFSALRLAALALDGLTAFTVWPLRAVSVVGFILALLAFGYGSYLTVDYLLEGHQVSGWTTIVVSLMLFAGIQMVSLGIVGEYVGRIFEEVKARPLYVVKQRRGRGLDQDGAA